MEPSPLFYRWGNQGSETWSALPRVARQSLGGRTRSRSSETHSRAFASTLTLLPRHTMGVLWNLLSLEKPVFLSGANSGRRKQSPGHVPLPQSFERPFVPSSMDIPQACSRQIHLPAGHNPCLHLWAKVFWPFLLLNALLCFLGNWSREREAGLGRPRANGVGGLPEEKRVCFADLAWEENCADYLPGPAAKMP